MAKLHIKGHSMNNKILLGAAISLATLQVTAQPFAPTDARGMAMGGTGVASAKTVHSVQYNPSLLSGGDESDDFGLLLPQVGGYVADEDEFIDSADAFSEADYISPFDDALSAIETPLNTIQTLIGQIEGETDATQLATLTGQLAAQTVLLTTGTGQLTSATTGLNTGLASISDKALRGGIGGGAGIAIPSKKFSVAISANNSTSFSGVLRVADSDLNTLSAYANGTEQYSIVLQSYSKEADDVAGVAQEIEDEVNGTNNATTLLALADTLTAETAELQTATTALDDFEYGTGANGAGNDIFVGGALASGADTLTLNSTVEIIAVAISEIALSISREFTIADRQVAIGVTPKLQRIDAYDYVVSVEDDAETDDISDYGIEDTGFNLDIGASTKFGAQEQGTVGVVIKNLMSRDVDTVNGNTVSISPQVRAGVAYQALGWVNLAADLDITENEPVAFEDPTQFVSLGAEADVLGFLQIRAGFRSNLASSGQDVVSAGLGLSPFGIAHIDLGAYTNTSSPEKEAGVVFELGLDW
jgi:hypothetical protein